MPKKIQHGGMKTIVQTEANCNAHATARCIYRLFKYLVDEKAIHRDTLNITLTKEQKGSYGEYVKYKNKPSGDSTKRPYEGIEEVESNQLELYNSLVPILTYNYYVLELLYNENYHKIEMINNKSIAYIGKLVKVKYLNTDETYEYREVNTTIHKNFATDVIINEIVKSQMFNSMKENKLNENNLKENKLNENNLKEKKLNKNKSNCKTDIDCVKEEFKKFYQYMNLIPDGYYMKKSSYKYSGDINNVNCEWIKPLIGILKKHNAFGLLGYKTVDLSHAVAISSIVKVIDKDEYTIRYKNSWGVKFGDEGIDEMVITNDTKYLEYYNIVVWTCEKSTNFENEVEKLRTTTKELFQEAKKNNHEYANANMYIPRTFIFVNEDFRTKFFKKPSDENEYQKYKKGNMTYFINKLTDHMKNYIIDDGNENHQLIKQEFKNKFDDFKKNPIPDELSSYLWENIKVKDKNVEDTNFIEYIQKLFYEKYEPKDLYEYEEFFSAPNMYWNDKKIENNNKVIHEFRNKIDEIVNQKREKYILSNYINYYFGKTKNFLDVLIPKKNNLADYVAYIKDPVSYMSTKIDNYIKEKKIQSISEYYQKPLIYPQNLISIINKINPEKNKDGSEKINEDVSGKINEDGSEKNNKGGFKKIKEEPLELKNAISDIRKVPEVKVDTINAYLNIIDNQINLSDNAQKDLGDYIIKINNFDNKKAEQYIEENKELGKKKEELKKKKEELGMQKQELRKNLMEFMDTKNVTIVYNYIDKLYSDDKNSNKKIKTVLDKEILNTVIYDCFKNNSSSDKNIGNIVQKKFVLSNKELVNELNTHLNEIQNYYNNYKTDLINEGYITENFIGMDMSQIVLTLHNDVVKNLNSSTQGGKRKSKKAKKSRKTKKSQKTKKAKKSRKKKTRKRNRKTRRH